MLFSKMKEEGAALRTGRGHGELRDEAILILDFGVSQQFYSILGSDFGVSQQFSTEEDKNKNLSEIVDLYLRF